MRIDLNSQAQAPAENEKSSAASPANTASRTAAEGGLGEDQAQLSGVHAQVQALASQAAQLPEIRQEKVNALRQVVLAGNYNPKAGQIAAALFGHMAAQPAA